MRSGLPGVAARPLAIVIHSSNEMFGADRMLLEVVRTMLAHDRFEVEVWLPTDVTAAEDSVEQRLRMLGATVLVRPLPILRRSYLRPRAVPALLGRMTALARALRARRPALVYLATSAALPAAPLARLAGCPAVVVHIQELWRGPEAIALGALAAFCHRAVAISEPVRRAIQGPVARRTVVIVNAVPDRAEPVPAPIAQSITEPNHQSLAPNPQANQNHPAPVRYLVASRWNSWKGHATLLAAWDSLPESPGSLVILGSPPERGDGVDVPGIVAGMRHRGSVSVPGQVSDIVPFIDEADVVLVPSDDPEPFGLVAIEAFSRYRPVVASREGGVGEIVTPGVTGALFENRSVAGLAAILAGITREDARAWGQAAREQFEREYSLTRFDEAFEGVWRTAIAATTARPALLARPAHAPRAPRAARASRSAATARRNGPRVRLYRTIRSAHLERAHRLPPATILYTERRYDFHNELAVGLDLRRTSTLGAVLEIVRLAPGDIEINEPLMRPALIRSAAVLAVVAVRDVLSRTHTRVATYAIENDDPFAREAAGIRGTIRLTLDQVLFRFVWSRVDRVAFGTSASRDRYRMLGRTSARRDEIVVPALPAAAPVHQAAALTLPAATPVLPAVHAGAKTPLSLVFLGSFSHRKGFPLVVDAWHLVEKALPGATLTLVGKGPLEDVARELSQKESVTLVLDPPREIIDAQLSRAAVLVLPSQRAPAWREQVGLPIVEGLAHGCEIVTTTETGLAGWLSANGHTVIDPDASARTLADALITVLWAPRPVGEILAALPGVDGRLAADRWLFDIETVTG